MTPDPQSDDDDQVRFGLGARYFGDQSLSGYLEWNTVLGREDFDSHTIQIQIRADF